jgi:hypothetical protein
VKDARFPEEDRAEIYWKLFQIWSEHKTGSANESGWNVLLALAQENLSHSGKNQERIAEAIQNWWHARRASALVSFVIEALDLLCRYVSDNTVLGALWKEIAPFIREDPAGYSPGEKSIMRRIGKRIGFDEESVRGSLGIAETKDNEAEDVLVHAKISKVAIVSLRERKARYAAEDIQKRSRASVTVVSAAVAGAETNKAKTADVILFVSTANKHAVYRAFDDVRDRLAYPIGDGKESIILALERWIIKQRQPAKG